MVEDAQLTEIEKMQKMVEKPCSYYVVWIEAILRIIGSTVCVIEGEKLRTSTHAEIQRRIVIEHKDLY